MVSKMARKLVCGTGINDADYKTQDVINGRKVACKFYQTWRNMIARCYDSKYQKNQPTYLGCTVSSDWLVFSRFKNWMETQPWQGCELDKDLLHTGNKIYSPETCVFVDRVTNGFMVDCGAVRGDWPIGVYFNAKPRKFHSQCRNPFTKKRDYLGLFDCPNKAHQAWKKRKHELACQLADLQTDPRVAQALRTRYL